MKAQTADIYGNVVIAFNTQAEQILSPCGQFQLLPCEICLDLHWKKLGVVSFLCKEICWPKYQRGEELRPEVAVDYSLRKPNLDIVID